MLVSFQGRRFAAQEFPSPADRLPRFSSCSRCLIDLGKTFTVLTEGSGPDGPPHHRMLFRLETVNRNKIKFEDDTQLSKDECAALLEGQLEALTECDIVKVRFPFYNQSQLHMYKFRPCIALYGTSGPPIYLAIYNGKPEQKDLRKWELALCAPEDISPDSAPMSVVDVTKMCGLPEKYDDPEQEHHEMSTYGPWYLQSGKKHHPVAASEPNALRGKVVAQLMQLLQDNPVLDYVDTTIEQDIGTLVNCKVLVDGEWCYSREVYNGPPGMSTEHRDLTVQTTQSLPPKSPAADVPPSPKVTP